MPFAPTDCRPDWDIFCRVVDNFGDIGVCRRLARDLARRHRLRVRLWVDDWAALVRLCPAAASTTDRFLDDTVEVRRWTTPLPAAQPASVVVEAFACELPDGFVVAMAAFRPRPVWINLEYLSAEPWVGECHGLASPHARLPLVKHFFFPGFVPDTGGLLREPGLLEARDAWQSDPVARADWLAGLALAPPPEALLVSLFCYAKPALPALLEEWARGERPVWLLVPEGRAASEVAAHFGSCDAVPGQRLRRGKLTACVLPFLSQDDYDRLLWCCDLNFVRGEDSFVRAQWAARPFVWHIYAQDGDAHRVKIEAFLDRYLEGADHASAQGVRTMWQAWNGEGEIGPAWRGFAAVLPTLGIHNQGWSARLAAMPDLATALVQFSSRAIQ